MLSAENKLSCQYEVSGVSPNLERSYLLESDLQYCSALSISEVVGRLCTVGQRSWQLACS